MFKQKKIEAVLKSIFDIKDGEPKCLMAVWMFGGFYWPLL